MSDQENCATKKKAIVAGATGFIGANLIRKLIERGFQVGILLRKESNVWRIDELLNQLEIYEVNHELKNEVSDIILKFNPTHVFNCAQPSFILLNDEKEFANILANSIHVLSNLLEGSSKIHGLESFIHCCSSTIYEWSSDSYILSENTNVSPTSLRGIVKSTERNLCKHYSSKNQLPVRLARIFRAYGPWDSKDKLIVHALSSIYKGCELSISRSEFKRDYVFVEDLAHGMIDLAKSDVKRNRNKLWRWARLQCWRNCK